MSRSYCHIIFVCIEKYIYARGKRKRFTRLRNDVNG